MFTIHHYQFWIWNEFNFQKFKTKLEKNIIRIECQFFFFWIQKVNGHFVRSIIQIIYCFFCKYQKKICLHTQRERETESKSHYSSQPTTKHHTHRIDNDHHKQKKKWFHFSTFIEFDFNNNNNDNKINKKHVFIFFYYFLLFGPWVSGMAG